ncbi:hypothetical protein Hypma_009450 [Hypsizygus marmoreus]|uniref:HNH nuclease domain-containing protein n=1 Tax=Hypsizygus marmoreus TaxID=39966 RepID=A0A369JSA3_HYPMA|nr:hypothetical protein Hypma_009450 [Hypsizygus marmoreus]
MALDSSDLVQIYIFLDNSWLPALAISTNELTLFAVYPLKWLLFVISTIYGRNGSLLLGRNGPKVSISDYTSTGPIHGEYFFSSGESPLFIDIDGESSMSSDADAYEHWDAFNTGVIERDVQCVFSGLDADICEPTRLIPRIRGPDYLQLVLDQSLEGNNALHDMDNGVPNSSNDLDKDSKTSTLEMHCNDRSDVGRLQGFDDDVRNGILLNANLHAGSKHSKIGFIMTPNFILSPNDIPHVAGTAVSSDLSTHRLTLHHFSQVEGSPSPFCYFHNVDAHIPGDSAAYPPAAIVNTVYCCKVLANYGSPAFIAELRGRRYDRVNRRRVDLGTETGQEFGRRKRVTREDTLDLMVGFWRRNSVATQAEHELHNKNAMQAKVESWLKTQCIQ